MASLGVPVEPDVQSQNPGDSSQVGHGSPSSDDSVSEVHSGEPVTITVAISGAATRMASSSPARSDETTNTLARLAATIAPRSRPGRRGLTGAGMAPSRNAPRNTS